MPICINRSGWPFAIHPFYSYIYYYTCIGSRQYKLISQCKGRSVQCVSNRMASYLLGRVGGGTKGGAVGEGHRSLTVSDTLIDPVEKGAITPN